MRPIDADALIEEIRDTFKGMSTYAEQCGATLAVGMLREAPTITLDDLRPHGRWGNYEPYSDGYRCLHCKLIHRSCTAYCPNCGAKMDKEDDPNALL